MRVLGVDPGSRVTGYGCVDIARPGAKPELVEAGVIRLGADPDSRKRAREAGLDRVPLPERLVELERDLSALIERLAPATVAVEALFAHYRHPATAIVMGHARGVVLLAVQRQGADLVELEPATVKKAVTGSGRASKGQMQSAVQAVFGLDEPPEPSDVADALAVALCAGDRAPLRARLEVERPARSRRIGS
ncbi:MAG: crossover junction endodeoxyribonuclease RuvC [Planctomycetota bacterium]